MLLVLLMLRVSLKLVGLPLVLAVLLAPRGVAWFTPPKTMVVTTQNDLRQHAQACRQSLRSGGSRD